MAAMDEAVSGRPLDTAGAPSRFGKRAGAILANAARAST